MERSTLGKRRGAPAKGMPASPADTTPDMEARRSAHVEVVSPALASPRLEYQQLHNLMQHKRNSLLASIHVWKGTSKHTARLHTCPVRGICADAQPVGPATARTWRSSGM